MNAGLLRQSLDARSASHLNSTIAAPDMRNFNRMSVSFGSEPNLPMSMNATFPLAGGAQRQNALGPTREPFPPYDNFTTTLAGSSWPSHQ